MTIKQKIQSLLNAANATTEAGDADLTAAVASLIAGYGGGDGLAYDEGSFTLSSASADPQIEDSSIYEPREVLHNLGVIPSVVCVWTDENVSRNNIKLSVQLNYGYYYDPDPDYDERSRETYELGFGACLTGNSAGSTSAYAIPFVSTPSVNNYTNPTTFVLPDGSHKYGAHTYHWIAIDLGLCHPSNEETE